MAVSVDAPLSLRGLVIARECRLGAVGSFFRSLPEVDVRARFGLGGPGAADWLIERLASEPARGVLTARIDDHIVAVMDHAHAGCGIELGVVVAATHRRLGIGSSLLRSLLGHARECNEPLLAHANRSNAAAVSFLLRNGFAVHGGSLDARLFASATA